eukprot:3027676-Pleurochrysis_carterae.AAC.1
MTSFRKVGPPKHFTTYFACRGAPPERNGFCRSCPAAWRVPALPCARTALAACRCARLTPFVFEVQVERLLMA